MPSEIQITDNDLILVTGATGFLATHVVKQLLEKGYRVRGTVRSLRDEKKLAPLRNLVPNSRFKLELVEADLLKEETWINAVNGCTYVIHTASPLPLEDPKDENEVIKPAVNGTLNVLRACVQDGSRVKRVVLTSSGLAIAGDIHKDGYTYSEKDWPKTEGLAPYSKSKVLAEKAAWDFVRERDRIREPCFELVVINPGFIMGPALQDSDNTSLVVVKRMMLGQLPVVPNVTITVCDVRDVATAHINALVIPEAKNNRHSIASLKGGSAFLDWAKILRDEFGSKGYKISTTKAPNFLIRIASCFEKDLTKITPMLGVKSSFDNSRMINVLGVQPRDIKTTVIDSAYSLIQRNLVPKKY